MAEAAEPSVTTKRERKRTAPWLTEADIPDLPAADASKEEKTRIMKERRRVQERLREQQRSRSRVDQERPPTAEASARRATLRVSQYVREARELLSEARRSRLPILTSSSFDTLVTLTQQWQAEPGESALDRLVQAWATILQRPAAWVREVAAGSFRCCALPWKLIAAGAAWIPASTEDAINCVFFGAADSERPGAMLSRPSKGYTRLHLGKGFMEQVDRASSFACDSQPGRFTGVCFEMRCKFCIMNYVDEGYEDTPTDADKDRVLVEDAYVHINGKGRATVHAHNGPRFEDIGAYTAEEMEKPCEGHNAELDRGPSPVEDGRPIIVQFWKRDVDAESHFANYDPWVFDPMLEVEERPDTWLL